MNFTVEQKGNIKTKPSPLVKKRNMDKIGRLAVNRVRIRTQQGLDIELKAFKEYSKSYSKQKGSNKVNLKQSGAMLSSVRYTIDGDTIVLYSNDPKAYKHQNGVNTPEREWLGIDKNIARDIDKLMLDAYEPSI